MGEYDHFTSTMVVFRTTRIETLVGLPERNAFEVRSHDSGYVGIERLVLGAQKVLRNLLRHP